MYSSSSKYDTCGFANLTTKFQKANFLWGLLEAHGADIRSCRFNMRYTRVPHFIHDVEKSPCGCIQLLNFVQCFMSFLFFLHVKALTKTILLDGRINIIFAISTRPSHVLCPGPSRYDTTKEKEAVFTVCLFADIPPTRQKRPEHLSLSVVDGRLSFALNQLMEGPNSRFFFLIKLLKVIYKFTQH